MIDPVFPASKERPLKLGLALGSGSARGWAHLGILRGLAREGVRPDLICGCSMGAFVGAAVAAGEGESLAEWACALKWQEVIQLLDVSLKGGLIKGVRLMEFFEGRIGDRSFLDLPLPFACVATDLASGREVWLKEGRLSEAVRASIALPGLMTPVLLAGRLLVDGGLLNPVPVTLCRAMGADIVVAVDLGSGVVGRALRVASQADSAPEGRWGRLVARVLNGRGRSGNGSGEHPLPSLAAVLASSISIMQERIARSRLAGDPADLLLSPRLGQIGPLDYHRATEAIAEGEAEVRRMLPAIRHLLEGGGS